MRVPGWEGRLIATIEQEQSHPFSWGSHDCLTFVSRCAEAVSGINPMEGVRPYETEDDAGRVLLELGYEDVSQAMETHFDEISVSMAGRGDCGIVELRGVAASVVIMGSISYGRSERGLIMFPTSRVTRAFKVG